MFSTDRAMVWVLTQHEMIFRLSEDEKFVGLLRHVTFATTTRPLDVANRTVRVAIPPASVMIVLHVLSRSCNEMRWIIFSQLFHSEE